MCEGEIGLIKYSTLETQFSPPFSKSVKFWPLWQMMREHLHGNESPEKEKFWNVNRGLALGAQVQYLITGESASLGVVSTNNWVKHTVALWMDLGLSATLGIHYNITNGFTPSWWHVLGNIMKVFGRLFQEIGANVDIWLPPVFVFSRSRPSWYLVCTQRAPFQ